MTIVCVWSSEAEHLARWGSFLQIPESKLRKLVKVCFIAIAVDPIKPKGLLCCEIKALEVSVGIREF